MLERDDDGRYSNTAATELFLDPAKPSYIGDMLEMANSRLFQFWGSLTEALRTGEPQSETKTGLGAEASTTAEGIRCSAGWRPLIVYEAIIDDDRRHNAFGLLMSLNMLIESGLGSDFTGEDCRTWMAETGFQNSYVEHLNGPDSMVVGIK